MKTNENEPQKATLERERKIGRIQCETPEYAQARQDRSQPRKTRKTRKKKYHRMKTNENEPQKAKLERERELNELEAKHRNTPKLGKIGVKHGRHRRNRITK